jgi:outer membrane lipoprotein SlyB
MSILGNLKVRLTAETEDFRRGLESAKGNLNTFEKSVKKARLALIAKVASVAAVTAAMKKSLEVAKQYDSVTGALAAQAKLTGQNLDDLNQISNHSIRQFKLSSIAAGGYTLQISKLADKAGGLRNPTQVMQAFLDVGAARGLSAAQSLEAVEGAVKGNAKALETLFARKPEELYANFAASIGKTVGQLTEQERAQALVNAAMADGESVRGEYQNWLNSAEGMQFQLSQGMETTAGMIGKLLQPALITVLPVLKQMLDSVQKSAWGWQRLGLRLQQTSAAFRIVWASVTRNRAALNQARQDWTAATDAVRDHKMVLETVPSNVTPPTSLEGRGDLSRVNRNLNQVVSSARGAKDAVADLLLVYIAGLRSIDDERRRLNFDIGMLGLSVLGTDNQRFQLELDYAKELLDIEDQILTARRKKGEITDEEFYTASGEVDGRRGLAEERERLYRETSQRLRQEQATLDRNDILLRDRLEIERLITEVELNRLGPAATLEQQLHTRLSLLNRSYDMQRQALLEDLRLTEEARQNELLRLELQRDREASQLRIAAAAEREAMAAGRRQSLQDQALGVVGGAIEGGISGKQIGAGLGAMAGTLVPVLAPLAAGVGGALGGMLDKMFGKQHEAQLTQLQAIERVQKETISAIETQTDRLLNPTAVALNLPTGFTMPSYMPEPSNGATVSNATYTGSTTVNFTFQISEHHTPDDVEKAVRRGLGNSLNDSRRSRGRRVMKW